MSLMSRIKITPFHTYSYEEKINLVTKLQALRTNSLEEARIKKGGMTKSAYKNKKKAGKSVMTKTKAIKELNKLSKSELKKLLEMYK